MAEYLDKAHLSYYTTKLMDKLRSIFVPQTRKVNNKALSSDISLDATDVLSGTQQTAVNSGITSLDVAKLGGIETGAQVNTLEGVSVNGSAAVITNKVAEVTVPTATSQLNNDSDFVQDASYVHTDNNFTNADATKLSGIATGAEVNVQANWNESDTTSDAYIQNKPTIPAAQIQSDWSQADFSAVDYIKNKPTIPAAQVQSNWTEADNTSPAYIQNKPTIPAAQVQSNWTEADSTNISYIQNKPTLAVVATSGDYDDLTGKPTIPPEMTILSYGHSTWADFLACYNTKTVVYCRASSNSNPATGSQTRMAFMAYVNNETNPTNVEFQYYRSVSSHSATQQGDQTYVYKLTNANGGTWSVTVRENYTRVVAGTGLTSTWSNGVLTISLA